MKQRKSVGEGLEQLEPCPNIGRNEYRHSYFGNPFSGSIVVDNMHVLLSPSSASIGVPSGKVHILHQVSLEYFSSIICESTKVKKKNPKCV